MASSTVTSFDSLPDELVLKIMKMSVRSGLENEDEEMFYCLDFLIDVLCQVSIRFRRLAADYSLWKGLVVIRADGDPRRAEFVVQKCLNSGTRAFYMHGNLDDYFDVLTCPRYAEHINPTKRFPNLKLWRPVESNFICWHSLVDDEA